MDTLEITQHYAIESYGLPGSNMEKRSSYQFQRSQIADAFHRWAIGKTIHTLIDIGSSTGFLTRKIKSVAQKVIAVDVNQKVLDAINDPDVTPVQDILPSLARLENASADVVISTDTMYYLSEQDIQIAVRRIHEILKPGGYLVFNDNGNAAALSQHLSASFHHNATVETPQTLRNSPNFDRIYWAVEDKYLFCQGVFNALADPKFDAKKDLSELRTRKLVQLCLGKPWLEHVLWLAWIPRMVARFFWSNNLLLQLFCVRNEPSDCLWVYQKKPDQLLP